MVHQCGSKGKALERKSSSVNTGFLFLRCADGRFGKKDVVCLIFSCTMLFRPGERERLDDYVYEYMCCTFLLNSNILGMHPSTLLKYCGSGVHQKSPIHSKYLSILFICRNKLMYLLLLLELPTCASQWMPFNVKSVADLYCETRHFTVKV